VKRIIKLLASGLGATSLSVLLFGGSPTAAAPVEKTSTASFQAPGKRLVLDYSPAAHAQGARSNALAHGSHSSHSSHSSHYSGR
jgi:hypothetical protein